MERQVAPAELEDILLKHPDVKEVVVVGVPHHEYGEAACAFVVLHDPSLGDESKLRKIIEGDCLRNDAVLFFLTLLESPAFSNESGGDDLRLSTVFTSISLGLVSDHLRRLRNLRRAY